MDAVDALLAAVRDAGLAPGSRLLLAVSGGPDSMALLETLHRESPANGWALAVAHVNHRLRGDESDADEQFVRQQAEARGLPCFSVQVDTRDHAAAQGESLEEAARTLRYDALWTFLSEWPGDVIVLGHTQDDQAETVVLQLLRGSGTAGLAGMRPRSGDLVRPFLGVRHELIVAALQAWHVGYRLDTTNVDERFTRNRVRRSIMPALERVQPRSAELIGRAARLLRKDDELLERVSSEALDAVDIAESESAAFAALGVWRALHPALRKRVLRRMARHVAGETQDVHLAHVETLEEFLANAQPRAELVDRLPHGINARVVGERFVLYRGRTDSPHIQPAALSAPGGVDISFGRITAELRPVADEVRNWVHVVGPFHALCDADRALFPLTVRSRRPGDRIRPVGGYGTRKLQDILVDAHVPRHLRDLVPVVEAQGKVLWVPGFAQDGETALGGDTTRILHLRFEPSPLLFGARMLGFSTAE